MLEVFKNWEETSARVHFNLILTWYLHSPLHWSLARNRSHEQELWLILPMLPLFTKNLVGKSKHYAGICSSEVTETYFPALIDGDE